MKIYGAEYFLPVAQPEINGGAICVENGKIVSVGKFEDLCKEFPNADREFFEGSALIPGFVNCHTHTEITAMRGYLDDAEGDFATWLTRVARTRGEVFSNDDVLTSSIAGAAECIRAGVTCVGDIGREGFFSAKALNKVGLRGVVYQETIFSPNNSTAEKDFETLINSFNSIEPSEIVEVGLTPHTPYTVSRRLFELIAEFALKKNVKITIHTAESKDEIDLLMRGEGFFAKVFKKFDISWEVPQMKPVEFLENTGILDTNPLLVHCVAMDESEIERVAKYGARVAHCPKSNAKLVHGIAPVGEFIDSNIPVGLGTDSVASNNNCDMFEEMRTAAFFERSKYGIVRPASDYLKMGTLGGAKALGLDKKIGTLETDKHADFAVVSLKNISVQPIFDTAAALVFSANARDVVLTAVNGREIYKNGRVETVDETELLLNIRTLGEKMRANPIEPGVFS